MLKYLLALMIVSPVAYGASNFDDIPDHSKDSFCTISLKDGAVIIEVTAEQAQYLVKDYSIPGIEQIVLLETNGSMQPQMSFKFDVPAEGDTRQDLITCRP